MSKLRPFNNEENFCRRDELGGNGTLVMVLVVWSMDMDLELAHV